VGVGHYHRLNDIRDDAGGHVQARSPRQGSLIQEARRAVVVVIDHSDCVGVMGMFLRMPVLHTVMRANVDVERRKPARNRQGYRRDKSQRASDALAAHRGILPAISYQLSATGYQLPATSYQRPTLLEAGSWQLEAVEAGSWQLEAA